MKNRIDPNKTGSFDQNSLISLVAKIDIKNDTMEDLIEGLKVLKPDQYSKFTCKQLIQRMTNFGEPMMEHEIREILEDIGMSYEDDIDVEEFVKTLYNK